MKRIHILLLSFAFITGIHKSTFAQEYTWDEYGVGFEVGRDFEVQNNSDSHFLAQSSDGGITISISPWQDSDITEDDLAQAIVDIAAEQYGYDGEEVEGEYIELDDFFGYFIVIVPQSDDSHDLLVVMLLMNPESGTNLAVGIGFDEGNLEEVKDIIDSFYAY